MASSTKHRGNARFDLMIGITGGLMMGNIPSPFKTDHLRINQLETTEGELRTARLGGQRYGCLWTLKLS